MVNKDTNITHGKSWYNTLFPVPTLSFFHKREGSILNTPWTIL